MSRVYRGNFGVIIAENKVKHSVKDMGTGCYYVTLKGIEHSGKIEVPMICPEMNDYLAYTKFHEKKFPRSEDEISSYPI